MLLWNATPVAVAGQGRWSGLPWALCPVGMGQGQLQLPSLTRAVSRVHRRSQGTTCRVWTGRFLLFIVLRMGAGHGKALCSSCPQVQINWPVLHRRGSLILESPVLLLYLVSANCLMPFNFLLFIWSFGMKWKGKRRLGSAKQKGRRDFILGEV